MKKDILENIQNLSFRYDINFLRAASVIAVIIYHIDKRFLPGGWLGVDIFFFISGYLISNKILNDLKMESLSLEFLYQRIKRILPAVISSLIYNSFCLYCYRPKSFIYI